MNIIPPQYRLAAKGIAATIVATALALLVLFAYEWVWHRGADSVQAKWDTTIALQVKQAAENRVLRAAAIAAIDLEHTRTLKEKSDEIAALRASIAAGTVRLRVAARCPDLPATPAGAGVGDGEAHRSDPVAGPAGGPYLDPAAEPAYFALKDGLIRQREQLLACQEILGGERDPYR